MKRIPQIEASLKALQPKLAIDARDWTKSEKEHIEVCYHAITKESVGWGRTVDLGCEECVSSAVNIIKNYLALVQREEKVVEEVADWKENLKTIAAKAQEVGFEFEKAHKTKVQKIEALEAFLAPAVANEQENEEDDLLGEEVTYTREQLVQIVKAKTGEDVPEETSYEDLLEYVNDLANGEE
jgi:vacuolar-type H+-ATPase subunit I/STV1